MMHSDFFCSPIKHDRNLNDRYKADYKTLNRMAFVAVDLFNGHSWHRALDNEGLTENRSNFEDPFLTIGDNREAILIIPNDRTVWWS
jgi:hypothetical protein